MTNNITVTQEKDTTPERGFNIEGVFWKAEDYDEIDFATGHLHVKDLDTAVPLTGVKVDDISLAEVDLMDEILWDEVSVAAVVHFSEGWEFIVLAGVDKDGPFKVTIPTVVFTEESTPAQMRIEFGRALKARSNAGHLSHIEGNMDRIFAWADEHITLTL